MEMITLKEGIQDQYTKAIIRATKQGQIDLMFTSKILQLIEKRADIIKNHEENYNSTEKYIIEDFLKKLLER